MQTSDTTRFDREKANALITRLAGAAGCAPRPLGPGSAEEVLRQFRSSVPACGRASYQAVLEKALDADPLVEGTGFSLSSGSSGAPLLSAKRLRLSRKGASLAVATLDSVSALAGLKGTDTVANLFTAGSFSFLYESINRLVERLGCNIVPLGKVTDLGEPGLVLRTLARLRTNVLFGTPSSVVSLAKAAEALGIRFAIEKVLFTGEKFSAPRRAYVEGLWPGVKIFGLYGQSEIGFIGINGPGCGADHYHSLDDSLLFLENDEEKGLLVTSFDEAHYVPILRYAVSDRVELLHACPCGHAGTTIRVLSRCNDTFKYSGNLVSARALIETLAREGAAEGCEVQIVLRSTQDLKDLLEVNVHPLDGRAVDAGRVRAVISAVPDIEEGVLKGTGAVSVRVAPYGALVVSGNQKTGTLRDLRI